MSSEDGENHVDPVVDEKDANTEPATNNAPVMSRRDRKKKEKKEKFEAETADLGEVSPFTVTVENDKAHTGMRDISLNKLSISVNGKVLFKEATLKLSAGSRYGLMGPNGRGKTTILKLLASRELPVPPQLDVLLVEQEQEFTASELSAVDAVLQSHKKQAAYTAEAEKLREMEELDDEQLERLRFLEEELDLMGVDSAESKARRILYGLGFPTDWHDRPTKSFSGGWRKRIALASAVFIEPDVLMLDEPTNHLDLNAVIWLEEYLNLTYAENTKRPKTLVVVSHDADFLDTVCTELINVENQKLGYSVGNFSNFEHKLQMDRSEFDKQHTKITKKIKEMRGKGKTQAQIDAFLRNEMQHDRLKEEHLTTRREYEVNFPFSVPEQLADACVCRLDDVSFHYPGGPMLFENVNVALWTNSRITLCGPNGIGKSTLLNLLTGVLEPTGGLATRNRLVRIGRYNQHFVEKMPFDITPTEYMYSLGLTEESAARKQLGCFGLESKAHKQRIETLSGGQKARVAFAAISAERPHFILLDEPTNHLDRESVDALCEAINNFQGGVLVVTHDARLIESTDMTIWIAGNKTVAPFKGDLDDYKDMIRAEFAAAEAERLEQLARRRKDRVETKELRADGKTMEQAKEELQEKQKAEQEAEVDALLAMMGKPAKEKKKKKKAADAKDAAK